MGKEIQEVAIKSEPTGRRDTFLEAVSGIGSSRFWKTFESIIRKGVRVGASVVLFVSTSFSPIRAPTTVNAESNLQQSGITLLHGDGSRDRLNIMLLPYNGTTTQMLQEVAEDIFLIPPTDEFKNKVNVYTTIPLENLNCKQNADCDYSAIYREVNRVVSMGIIPQETLVVIKSNEQFVGAGLAGVAGRSVPPDIYTFSQIVRPEVIPPEFKEFFAASAIAHELWGHAFAGFLDNEPGVPDLMTHYSGVNSFNPQHTQFLRSHFALTPQNYLTPKNEIKPLLVPVVSGQILQLQEMSFSAVVYTPTGTKQLYSEIRPFNDDGPGVFDYIGDQAQIHAWSEIGRRIPPPPQWYGLLPDMTYTWKVCSSGLSIPLPTSPLDPRWTQVEGWPGIIFPNPCAEIKIKTPTRDSSKIGLVTLAGSQETKKLNPTLVWINGDPDVFYYEVQVSKDSTFNTDPNTATAAVYWELRHGGVTNPQNSYTIPKEFPLEKGTTYYWRVRPRIQGDGTPVAWSQIGSFKTTADARIQTQIVLHEKENGEIDWTKMHADHWQQITKSILTDQKQAVLPRKEDLTPAV